MECGCNREEANVNDDDNKVTALFTGICSLTTDQHMQIILNFVDNNPKDAEYVLYTCYSVILMSYVIMFQLYWYLVLFGCL